MDARSLEYAYDFDQTIVAAMYGLGPFGRCFAISHTTVLSVIVVQSAELQAGMGNGARQRDNFVTLALLDAGAIHARIDVEKNSHAAGAPLPHLLLVLRQRGNAYVRELLRYVLCPARIRAHRRISEENIGCAVLAGHQQFQRGGAFEIAYASLNQQPQSARQLRGFDVHPPAIGVAGQPFQGAIDVCRNEIWIHHQRRSQHVVDAGHAVALIPSKFAQHGFLRCHHGLDDNA